MFGRKMKGSAAAADSALEEQRAAGASSSASGPAGFWLRVLAAFADSALVFAAIVVIVIVCSFAGDLGEPLAFGLTTLVSLLYWPVMHASVRQATFGKAMLGLRVTDANGNRLSMLRSFGREFAKILSAIPLGIGFLMAAFTGKKRALHDMVASTLVERDGEAHIARTVAVTVVAYAAPMVAIPLVGTALFAGIAASVLGNIADEMKAPPTPPAVVAKPAAPKAAAPAPAPAPAAPAPAASAPVAAAPAGTSVAPAPAGAAKGAEVERATPAKEAAPSPGSAQAPAPKRAAPPDDAEVKAPGRSTARTQSASSERVAARAPAPAPAPAQEARPGIAPPECVIKPVMSDDEINACRRR